MGQRERVTRLTEGKALKFHSVSLSYRCRSARVMRMKALNSREMILHMEALSAILSAVIIPC